MTESYFLKSNDLDLSLDEFDKESYENLPIDEYHKNSLKYIRIYFISKKLFTSPR